MPIDANIALQGQAPQFANPLDIAAKAQNLRQLAFQNDLNQRQATQQMAMSDLIRRNSSIDQNGMPTVNMTQLSSQGLAPGSQVNPQDLMKYVLDKHNNDIEAAKKTTEASGNLAAQATPENWDYIRTTAQKLGLPNAQMLPAQYDPKFVNDWRTHTQTGAELIKNEMENRKLGIEQGKNDIEQQNLALSRQKNQSEQVQQTLQALQSAKGNPAVQKAENDIYSDAKVNKLVNQMGADPNKLPMPLIHLLAGEVGKIGTGGVPGLEETKNLTPGAVPQIISEYASNFENKPTPANAGAFVKVLQKYSNGVASDARDLLKQNYQGIIETKKPWLPADSYKTLNDQFLGRLNGSVAPGSEWSGPASAGNQNAGNKQAPAGPTAHPQAAMALQWARDNANSSDPVAQAKAKTILTRLGL